MSFTIRQIAEIAGVSRGTVDKVLHGREGVSDEVRARVEDVIRKAGYVPNRLATELSQSVKGRRIAVLMTPLNPFAEKVREGALTAAKELRELNCSVNILVMREFREDEQAESLHQIIDTHPDGIAVMGLDGSLTRKALQRAEEEHIPVVTLVSDIADTARICFVGQDIPRGARAAAELLARAVGKKGRVAILHGPISMSAHRQRIESFENELSEGFPQVRVSGFADIHDDDETAYREAGFALEDPQLAGIYVTGAGVGAVARAVKEQGRDVRIVCFDLTQETERLLREDEVDFVIDQGAFAQGREAVRLLWDYLVHKTAPTGGCFYTDTTIYVKALLK